MAGSPSIRSNAFQGELTTPQIVLYHSILLSARNFKVIVARAFGSLLLRSLEEARATI